MNRGRRENAGGRAERDDRGERTMDPRIWHADEWNRKHRWLEAEIDRLTVESRFCVQQERRLRDEVRREAEAREHQELADAELVRRAGRRRRAA